MNRTPFSPALRILPVLMLALPLGCSSSSTDAGPPVSAQQYFNLVPGQSFAYTSGDAGPTRTLQIQSVCSPPGEISVTSLKRGQVEQIEYLTFDDAGATVFLNQRDVYPTGSSGGGIDSRLFANPLTYLVAPLAYPQSNLTSGSTYTGTSSGYESYSMAVLGSQLWTQFGADAGGSTAYQLQFSGQDDGGGGLTQNRTMLPGIGFVQIYAQDDLGAYVNFTLVAINVLDGGTPCH